MRRSGFVAPEKYSTCAISVNNYTGYNKHIVRLARHKLTFEKFVIILAFLLVVVTGLFLILKPDDKPISDNSLPTTSDQQPKAPTAKKTAPLVNLQPVVDYWAAKQTGTTSVVVYDLANDKTVASLNPSEQYFTASLYKLFVAYIGYQKVADGTYNLSDTYLSGYNRGQCLDTMIRDSYSPCGEKMWNELGKSNLTTKMKAYGLKNTDLTGLTTSAKDTSIILKKIFNGDDLPAKYRKLYLDSMKTQPALYRRGLPSGFSKSVVYNKVGWNGQVEWHDGAIITLPSGRSYVVAVLTKNVGSQNIAELGKMIENKLTN